MTSAMPSLIGAFCGVTRPQATPFVARLMTSGIALRSAAAPKTLIGRVAVPPGLSVISVTPASSSHGPCDFATAARVCWLARKKPMSLVKNSVSGHD